MNPRHLAPCIMLAASAFLAASALVIARHADLQERQEIARDIAASCEAQAPTDRDDECFASPEAAALECARTLPDFTDDNIAQCYRERGLPVPSDL